MINFPGVKLSKHPAPHPLDPLSAEEVVSSAKLCRAYVAENGLGEHRFNSITVKVGTWLFRLSHACCAPIVNLK